MKAFRHPFFRPTWRRVLIVALMAGWTGVELYFQNTVWAAIFAAFTAGAIYEWFIAFNPENYEDNNG